MMPPRPGINFSIAKGVRNPVHVYIKAIANTINSLRAREGGGGGGLMHTYIEEGVEKGEHSTSRVLSRKFLLGGKLLNMCGMGPLGARRFCKVCKGARRDPFHMKMHF